MLSKKKNKLRRGTDSMLYLCKTENTRNSNIVLSMNTTYALKVKTHGEEGVMGEGEERT